MLQSELPHWKSLLLVLQFDCMSNAGEVEQLYDRHLLASQPVEAAGQTVAVAAAFLTS
jgi:hypothetical protein